MGGTQSQGDEVRLIAFEGAIEAADVRSDIRALGHATSELPPPNPASGSPRPQIVVVVFHCPVRDKQLALKVIASLAGHAVLGVFAHNCSKWDDEIIDACSEFVGWPCNPRELGNRLGRLASRVSAKPDQVYAVDVSTEFALHNLVGNSRAFRRVLRQVERASRYDVPVLLEGDTGTGKEMVARALHYMGARANHPFIPVNCGALPDSLVENELFGHEKGAFTGAGSSQPGLVRQAQGGDLFLDEIDSLSAKAQVSLLRFLESHEFRPLGSRECQYVDVRVIAASNTGLRAEVESGAFRQDLYFRLNILSLKLPPLKDRDGDIELLADHFMNELSAEFKQPKSLSSLARARMRKHDWPGNVRELENHLRREFLLNDDSILDLDSLAEKSGDSDITDVSSSHPDATFNVAKAQAIRAFERKYLCKLMKKARGNVTRAAVIAGKERRAMGKLLKKYGIDKTAYF